MLIRGLVIGRLDARDVEALERGRLRTDFLTDGMLLFCKYQRHSRLYSKLYLFRRPSGSQAFSAKLASKLVLTLKGPAIYL